MKNTAIWTCKILLGLCGLMLIFSGFMWGFAPETNFETYHIIIDEIVGKSMVQTDISAPLIVGGIFLLLFSFKGNRWFLPMFIFSAIYLLIRGTTLFTMGFDNTILFGVVFEFIVLILLVVLKKLRE